MYGRSEHNRRVQPGQLSSVKIVISGGFGVGKTTFIGAISEIEPLATEAVMTEVSIGVDDTSALADKNTTTVALDFGRITLDKTIVLYLFGTPGQERFAFLWDDLAEGALGAVVLADTRRIEDCFPAVNYFEERSVPFLLAVNQFEDSRQYELDEVREAIGLDQAVPIVKCDARERNSVKEVLVALLERVLMHHLRARQVGAAGR